MPGFLKQLQKPKHNSNSSVSDVLIAPAEGAANSAPVDKRVAQAEQLLEDLIAESDAPIAGVGEAKPAHPDDPTEVREKDPFDSKKLRVVRRNRGGTQSGSDEKRDEDSPWWLTGSKEDTPQLEALIPKARRMLNEVLSSEDEEPVELPIAVRDAVQLAADALRDEMRLSRRDQENAERELLNLLQGKGPLQALYDDKWVTDIFIDDHQSIKVIRRGQALETPFSFRSAEEYRLFTTAMLQTVERALNLSSPIIDCVLDDHWRSRVNAIDGSLLEGDEPRVCIRIPRLQQVAFFDILQTKTLPATLAAWLSEVVACGEANILVMGPTGSGKTVMTTALLGGVGSDERVITIEDVPEIFVQTAHLEKLVARPANAQGEGAVTMPHLLKAALRRAPHRIVVGEIRDEEGRLFLRALETGHAGSIATIHADSAEDGLWRLLDLVAAYESAPQESIMRRISRSVHIVLTMRKVNGKPCLIDVSEVRAPGNGNFGVTPLVSFAGEVDGKRQWKMCTQNSYWLDLIASKGMPLRPGPGLLALEEKKKPQTQVVVLNELSSEVS